MINIPEKIYLQIEDDGEFDDDFNEISTTWCSDKINETDIEYVRANGIKPLLCDVLGIAKQEINVYEMPDGDFAFANAGIISDGFPSREQAEIAAYKAVLSGIIATIEAEHFA